VRWLGFVASEAGDACRVGEEGAGDVGGLAVPVAGVALQI